MVFPAQDEYYIFSLSPNFMTDLLSEFFLSFGILAILALAGGLLSVRLKQPAVVVLLLIGLLVDPAALGVIQNKETIAIFAEIGATLLLFSIGLEFSLQKIIGSGVRALLVSCGRMFVCFVVGYEAGVLLGLDFISSTVLGACFAFSATAIFVRLISSHGLGASKAVPLLISVTIIEDVTAVAVLAFFASYSTDLASGSSSDLTSMLTSILFSIALMGAIYLLLQRAMGFVVKYFKLDQSNEFILLLSLGLCVALSLFATQIGLSVSIGAFLAGSIIAGLSIRHEVEKLISPFSLAFSSFFFLSVGLLISPSAIMAAWPLALLLAAIFIVVSSVSIALLVYLAGYELEDAVLSGSSMAVMSEFSLIVASQTAHLLPDFPGGFNMVAIAALIVVFSALFSSFMLSSRERIIGFMRHLAGSQRAHVEKVRSYVTSVIGEFEEGGSFLPRTRETFKSLLGNFAIFAVFGLLLFLARRSFPDLNLEIAGYSMHVQTIALFLAFIPLAMVLVNIIRGLRLIADAINSVFVRIHPTNERSGRRIARDFLFMIPVMALILTVPIAIDFLRLPAIFHILDFVPLAAGALLGYDALSAFFQLHSKRLG